jgi:hypothetical protein
MGANNNTTARQRRLFENVLDAADILTSLRRELHVFCSKTLGLHTVLGQIGSDPAKTYLKGMHKVAEEIEQLLRRPRKPAWRERWAEERHGREAEIARIQRRPDYVRISLLPEPKSQEDLERFLRMSEDAKQLEKLDKRRVDLLRKLKKCDLSSEGGQFEADALLADFEENDQKMNSLQLDMAIDWVVAMKKAIEDSPKGKVKPIPRCERLMLGFNAGAGKVSAYRVSSTTENIG